jgi:hypothetical protein
MTDETQATPFDEPGEPKKRLQMNVQVSAKTKQLIEAIAEEQGMSQGRAVELLIERCLLYDGIIAALSGVNAAFSGFNKILSRLRE